MQGSENPARKTACEEAIVKNFIQPHKQERYSALLANPKKRKELLQRLGHGQDLNEACMIRLPAGVQTADTAFAFLKEKGAASECYLVSEKHDLDGKFLPLKSAVDQVFALGYGSIIYCFPEGIGYFEGEGNNERYLLKPN